MGALLNLSYSDINFDRPISFNCDPRSGSNGPPGGAGVILPTCVGGLNQFGDYQRPQVNAAFQWRPSEGLELYADGIYTEYESRWETDFIFSDVFAAQSISNVSASSQCASYRVQGAGFSAAVPAIRCSRCASAIRRASTMCPVSPARRPTTPGRISICWRPGRASRPMRCT